MVLWNQCCRSSLVISPGKSMWLFLLLYFSCQVLNRAQSRCSSDGCFYCGSGFHLRQLISISWFVCVCVCCTSWMYAIKSPFRDFSLPHFPPLIRRNRYILFCLLMAVFMLSIYGLYRSRVNTIWCQYSSNIVMQPSYIYDLFPL